MLDIQSFSSKVQDIIGESHIVAESLDHSIIEGIHLLKAVNTKAKEEVSMLLENQQDGFSRLDAAVDAQLKQLGKSSSAQKGLGQEAVSILTKAIAEAQKKTKAWLVFLIYSRRSFRKNRPPHAYSKMQDSA